MSKICVYAKFAYTCKFGHVVSAYTFLLAQNLSALNSLISDIVFYTKHNNEYAAGISPCHKHKPGPRGYKTFIMLSSTIVGIVTFYKEDKLQALVI